MTAGARIVLYYPRLDDTRRGWASGRDIMPLPLLAIAAEPHAQGHDVVVIDGNLYDDAHAAHRAVVSACETATLLGISSILGKQVSDGYHCARAVRARHPGLFSVAGGWFPTVLPEMHLKTGLWDAVALGQGEVTFRELVQAVVSGADLEGVPGLALPRDGGVHYTDPRRPVGWDELRKCAWDLVDFEPYRAAQLAVHGQRRVERMPRPTGLSDDRPLVGISYNSSYGCPEICSFCCSPEVLGRRWKAMPAERMLDELAELRERWEFDVVRFTDANWGVAEERVREFCAGKIERQLDFHWGVMMEAASLRRYRESTRDLMADAGCCLVLLGAETGSEQTMTGLIGKRSASGDNMFAAQELQRRGVPIYVTYIVGLPGEDEASMRATLEEARQVQAVCPEAGIHVFPYLPIPGAASYQAAIDQGFQPPADLLAWGEVADYREHEVWPGNLPPAIERRLHLFHHYATLSKHLARGHDGPWVRHARRRLERGDWRFARLEAKAFDMWSRVKGALA